MKEDTIDLKESVAENRLVGLWRMMVGFRWVYLGAALTLGLGASMKTATYYLLRYLIDDVLGEGRFDITLVYVAFGFIGLALVEGGFTYLSGRLAALTAEGVALRLRNYLFDHLQHLSFTYHDQTQTGELIQRSTSDVDTIRRFFAQEAIGLGRVLLLFLINFIAIYTLYWPLAFLSIIIVPILAVMSYFFFSRISQAYELYQEQEAALSNTLQENLSGIRVVKAFARQRYERERFDQDSRERFRRGRRLLWWHTIYWPSTDILAGFQMVGGYVAGAIFTINGTITLGTYLAYTGMVIWLIWPMRILGRLIVQMSQALVSYRRVTELLQEEKEPVKEAHHEPEGDLQGEVRFENVSFQYQAGEPVLQEISFHCEPGQTIALLGGTGSGKSSVVSLLTRFYEVDNGRILLDGVDIRHYARHYLRRQIGIVEQEPFLFSRTIAENIAYGANRSVSQAEIEEAARIAAIHDVICTFPNGYNTLVGERGVTLSGGQKQRVAIARTLLKDPHILILDDATSSVDTETEASIRTALQELRRHRSTFIIAHRVQSVMSADLILVLERGQIVQRGTHSSLLAEPGIYRQIYTLQSRLEDELQQELAVGV